MKQADSPNDDPLQKRHQPAGFSDRVAFRLTGMLRFIADSFFAKRYGHRAVVLETVAAVPGMVGGMVRHMRSLRHLENDRGWIHTLLSEAENERMHLMTFVEIARRSWFERMTATLRPPALARTVIAVRYRLCPTSGEPQ